MQKFHLSEALSLQKYLALVKAVETGNLTKAAEQLGYTQSGVSHMIQALETELGFPLLVRSRNGARLTANGEQLYPAIREIALQHTQIQQIAAEIRGVQTGVVRIGTFTSVAIHWLPRIMREFRSRYPQIELQVHDASYTEVEEWLEDGKVDCGFTVQTSHREFITLPLKEDRLLAVLPEGHPLCRYQQLPLSELKNETFIMPAEGAHHDVGQILRHAAVRAQSSFSTASDYAAIAMVKNGLGISILPEMVLTGYPISGVETRDLAQHGSRIICIATPPLKYVAPATHRFVTHVLQWVSALKQNE